MTLAVRMSEASVAILRPEGFRRLAYVRWEPASPGREAEEAACPVICVHGLTRNGRDFDRLAQGLGARGRTVYCPDMPGRGRSDWLADPTGYDTVAYGADLTTLLARTGAATVDWVGTSMGGLIGMGLAAVPGSPIRRLVLNDVGPRIEGAALSRLRGYVGQDPVFGSMAEVEAALRLVHAGFGALDDAAWRHMTEHGHRVRPDGSLGFACDPAILTSLLAMPEGDVELWPIWEAIRCPVLVLRGARSDLLSAETTARMAAHPSGCTVVEVPDAGHAPGLMAPDQIEAIARFLGEP
ncbi:alpha/beta fold hydrolase [Pararhodospirillum oryzae]|uniref:Alpha/beta hydrolase n=1 Tax=Pararhodospirillum oryzae TaxID=478448 RepID=A0A512H4T0_9PROT|nr:alpha/beta hydrolase [Pararhodospirillum oryzae]GEO80475.1 alpha/beta hydrolase [Pararhodospirillum oryzae]